MTEPDEVDAGLDRAIALAEIGRHREALRIAGQLLAQAPERLELWLLLAACHAQMGGIATAERAAKRAIGLAPDAYLGYAALAYARLTGGRPDTAVSAAWAAVRHGPDAPTAHGLLALALAGSADEAQRAEAVIAADRACELAPDDAYNHFVRGFVAHLQDAPTQARRSYQRALSLDPGHAETQHNLALLDAGEGEPLRALSGLVGTLRVDPGHEGARTALGVFAWVGVAIGFALNLALTRFTVKAINLELPARLGVDILMAVAVPGLLVVLLWRAPAAVRSWISHKLRRDSRYLVSMAGVLACSAGLAVCGVLRPHLAAWVIGGITCIAIVGLLALMLGTLAEHADGLDSADVRLAVWYPVWTAYGLVFAELWLMRAVMSLSGPVRVFGGLACAALPPLVIALAGLTVGRRIRPLPGAKRPLGRSLLVARVGVLICALGFVVATFAPVPFALAALLANFALVVAAAVQGWYINRRRSTADVR